MLGKSDSPNNRPSNNKKFRAIFKLATTAFTVGVGIGVLTWILASILGIGTNLLWYELRASLDWWFFPLLVCVPAGLLIGIIEKKHHSNPKQFPTIFESIKTLGTYSAGNFGAATLSFMAPLLFGGSVGPGVGIFGLLSTFISRFVPQFRTMSMQINESFVVRVGDKGDEAGLRLTKKNQILNSCTDNSRIRVIDGSIDPLPRMVSILSSFRNCRNHAQQPLMGPAGYPSLLRNRLCASVRSKRPYKDCDEIPTSHDSKVHHLRHHAGIGRNRVPHAALHGPSAKL